MSDNIIKVNVSSSNNKKVNVSSLTSKTDIAVSPDTARFYSQIAKNWAVSDAIVDGQDYSSKYYANKSQIYADNVLNSNIATKKIYEQFLNESVDILNNLQKEGAEFIEDIETKKNESIEDINNSKTTILNDIEFVADGEKEEIQNLADEIRGNAEDIINRVGISMFDTILKDHVLTYEESKGLAIQGTYVYKEAIAGSRYGYPDFYNKCIQEYNQTTTTETVNGATVRVHSNGHKFYAISDKTIIDEFFNIMGTAWFYGIDTENERVFLPRNNYFEQATGDVSEVSQSVEAGLPNITGDIVVTSNYSGVVATGAFYNTGKTATDIKTGGSGATSSQAPIIGMDGSKASAIYSNSNTVQPNAVKKLLYICVGNIINYEGITDVVNQGVDILEQVNQGVESRVKLDCSNLTTEGTSLISGFAMPSGKYIDLEWGASGTVYTAPANGYFYAVGKNASSAYHDIALFVEGTSLQNCLYSDFMLRETGVSSVCVFVPVKQGMKVTLVYYTALNTDRYIRFIYAEGEK